MSTHTPSYRDASNATANPDGSPNILRFGDGLMLFVQKSGVKTWRVKVMRDGKLATLTLGHFPAMQITEAKAKRMQLRVAIDPIADLRQQKLAAKATAANTFREVAAKWIEARAIRHHWEAQTRRNYESRLANDVFPTFGDRPIAEIGLDDVMSLISKIHAKRPALAVSIKQIMSGVFDFAIRWKLATMNPVAVIAEDLPIRHGVQKSHPYMQTIEDARRALAAVERRASNLLPSTVLAHRLMALTNLRKMEVVEVRWSEFDLAAGVWTIPAERMKGKYGKRREHSVALSPQAIEVLEAAKRIAKPGAEFVFQSEQGAKPISRCTLNDIMTRSQIEGGLKPMPPHGWRGTFSTIMNERHPELHRVIEAMLAHVGFAKGSSEGHYNHAKFDAQRHAVASEWADLLLDGAPTALALIGIETAAETTNVVALRPAA